MANDSHALGEHLKRHDSACAACGYNLRGLSGAACPECGAPVTLKGARRQTALARFGRLADWPLLRKALSHGALACAAGALLALLFGWPIVAGLSLLLAVVCAGMFGRLRIWRTRFEAMAPRDRALAVIAAATPLAFASGVAAWTGAVLVIRWVGYMIGAA